jgi:anti-sigma factor RsiW
MITCRELIDFLMDYVNGALPVEQVASFERHLNACPPCREYLQNYRDTIQVAKSACRGAEPLPQMPEELVRAILAARKTQPK